MLIGNPYKFCFLIERIPEWEGSYINGIMFVIVNGELYPKEVRTTTFNSEFPDILRPGSAFINPVNDKKLYDKRESELLSYIADVTYPKNDTVLNDYRFLIFFHEINDSGYNFFILSNGENIKILVGKWKNENIEFVDKVIISMQEYNLIKSQIIAFYKDGEF